MGGNALKQFDLSTHRLRADDFHVLEKKIVDAFSSRFPGVRVAPIPAYSGKTDFGDLDLLVERENFISQGGVDALALWAQERGFSRAQIENGLVTSLDWRSCDTEVSGFQVDFITSPSSEFDMALHYYSFNDLGNLVGRIASNMGLVYGHQGLLCPLRDGTHEFDRLVVCADPDRALEFLGYDSQRFKKGFKSLEEIFSFAASTPYFHKDIYLLENRNYASRTRDKKRKTYREFLQWIEHRGDLTEFTFPEDKATWLPHILSSFPEFEQQYQQSWARLGRQRNTRSQFNGEAVAEMTGLSGKELGHVMSAVRLSLGVERIEELLQSGGLEALRSTIEEIAASSLSGPPRPGPR